MISCCIVQKYTFLTDFQIINLKIMKYHTFSKQKSVSEFWGNK